MSVDNKMANAVSTGIHEAAAGLDTKFGRFADAAFTGRQRPFNSRDARISILVGELDGCAAGNGQVAGAGPVIIDEGRKRPAFRQNKCLAANNINFAEVENQTERIAACSKLVVVLSVRHVAGAAGGEIARDVLRAAERGIRTAPIDRDVVKRPRNTAGCIDQPFEFIGLRRNDLRMRKHAGEIFCITRECQLNIAALQIERTADIEFSKRRRIRIKACSTFEANGTARYVQIGERRHGTVAGSNGQQRIADQAEIRIPECTGVMGADRVRSAAHRHADAGKRKRAGKIGAARRKAERLAGGRALNDKRSGTRKNFVNRQRRFAGCKLKRQTAAAEAERRTGPERIVDVSRRAGTTDIARAAELPSTGESRIVARNVKCRIGNSNRSGPREVRRERSASSAVNGQDGIVSEANSRGATNTGNTVNRKIMVRGELNRTDKAVAPPNLRSAGLPRSERKRAGAAKCIRSILISTADNKRSDRLRIAADIDRSARGNRKLRRGAETRIFGKRHGTARHFGLAGVGVAATDRDVAALKNDLPGRLPGRSLVVGDFR